MANKKALSGISNNILTSNFDFIGKAVLRGILSVKILLRGAKQIPTGEKLRLYKKTGTYKSAVKEFLSLDPAGAHEFNLPDGVSVS